MLADQVPPKLGVAEAAGLVGHRAVHRRRLMDTAEEYPIHLVGL